ncbi:MAG: PadR family transcriptional regulator, partial [Methanobacterium sp.]|nr:PadR family transcriptional regulator [Methanobacterium sp.]
MVNSELIVLGLIYFKPSHGYIIKKNVKHYFGNPYYTLNNNVLYNTLKKLEENGYINGEQVAMEKINKKVYTITKEGEKHLIELVAKPAEPGIDEFDFRVKAVFFDLIPRETRIEAVKPLYKSKLEMLRESTEKKEKYDSFMPIIAKTVLEYGIVELKNSVEFLEKIMEY